jgi:putative ABC transport system permease protein
VRAAIGATRAQLTVVALREGITPTVVGAGAGIAAAYMVTRFMRAMLFGVSPVDGVSFAAAPVLLLGVALVACLLPAIRTSRIDPMMTLRTE